MGDVVIPDGALYGASTQRAVQNFPVSGRGIPAEVVHAFGLLKAAQPLMQSQGIPKEIASIIQGAILLFVAMKYAIDHLGGRLARSRNHAKEGE